MTHYVTTADGDENIGRTLRGLRSSSPSVRLQAALAAGTTTQPRLVGALIEQCGIEPDFYVRDMLTWALTRQPASLTVPGLVAELGSSRAQARSQALHTLSKIGDRSAWPAITRGLLTDPDDEVARSAWRAAVVLVPTGAEAELGRVLATQLGRGDRAMRLSLSRALVALGEVTVPILLAAVSDPDARVRQHAVATQRLLRDPDTGSEYAIEEAKRVVALGPATAEG